MSRYRVSHLTRYEYEAPVLHATHLAHLAPRPLPYQRLFDNRLEISPAPASLSARQDYFGNTAHLAELLVPHETLEVKSESLVEVTPAEARRQKPSGAAWEKVRDLLASDVQLLAAREFCFDSPLIRRHARLARYAEGSFLPGRSLVDSVLDLSQRIFDEFSYDPRATDISTPLGQVLRERRGVCQDFAHLAVGCLRSIGLAARYVSGYLETMPPEGGKRLIGADASHAWASTYVPDFGWLDFDPTNAVLPAEHHITVAFGRDFSDVSPLRGVVLGGGSHTLTVGVDVVPDA